MEQSRYKPIKPPIKIRIYETAAVTIVSYGAEVWNTTKKYVKVLEVSVRTTMSRILKTKFFPCF